MTRLIDERDSPLALRMTVGVKGGFYDAPNRPVYACTS